MLHTLLVFALIAAAGFAAAPDFTEIKRKQRLEMPTLNTISA